MPSRRRLLLGGLALLVLLPTSLSAVGCALSAPRWSGAPSDHFDGEKFFTPNAPPMVGGFGSLEGLSNFLKWQSTREKGPWKPYRDEPVGPPPPRDVVPGAMHVTFINHATTLIQLDGVNVLTDPMYSRRCSPTDVAGPERVRPPGIRFEDLPRIDAVVLSHNHYDHLDVPTLKRIADTWPRVQIFAGLGNKAFLASKGIESIELDWWDSRQVGDVTITSVPNQHFSNRGLTDANGTLWSAWVLSGAKGRAYFGGDTGYGKHFAEIARRLGPMRLAVVPIGAYRPEWFMAPVHMSPKDAVQAALDLDATLAVPMHFGTFSLADDGEDEPVQALQTALLTNPAPFRVLGFGEGVAVPERAP
jgi:L-ascorbate metabolism protein UlaG (beta-lactamase superfamily)